MLSRSFISSFFFFNDTATTEIYTLSLHDALPISGGAYAPALKKVDQYFEKPLRDTLAEREDRAQKLLELDEAVVGAVEKLKARGLTSPYLKAFVVARINPLRFIKGTPPSFGELLETMTKRARGMEPARGKTEDPAPSGRAPAE